MVAKRNGSGTSPLLDAVLKHADENLDQSLARLFELIRIPSISTDPQFAPECRRAAEWVARTLGDSGISASLVETAGHPIVRGRHDGQAEPRALFYGHYDVQPVDSSDQWDHDPFTPSIVEISPGRKIIRGRGACDDKGQMMTFIEACKAWLAVSGSLPISVDFLVEGEEESGSASLTSFIEGHWDGDPCDLALICDTYMWSENQPAITTSLRGIVYEEIRIRAANRDLHSGSYGGAAVNPIHVIAEICAKLRSADGRINLPGFQGFETLPAVRERLRNLDFSTTGFLGPVGLTEPIGAKDRSLIEKITLLPSCDVNGIWGGYSGEGSKTVIPAEAGMKVSFRIVAGQDPAEVRRSLHDFVRALVPVDCRVEFKTWQSAPAVWVSPGSDRLGRAAHALHAEWGEEPVLVGTGGSVPVVTALQRRLRLEPLMIGFALREDRVHAPNEKYEMRSFHKGIRAWVRVLAELAHSTSAAE